MLLKDQASTYNISSNDFIKKILVENNDIEAINEGAIKIFSGNLNLHQLNSIYNVFSLIDSCKYNIKDKE